MRNMTKAMQITLLLLMSVGILNAQTPFSLDSAIAYVRTLSVDIGPRPMGSPNERLAMDFAIGKFREFGLDDAYIMPMSRTESEFLGSTNTNSGVAVGVLKGSTDRIIVIGGHIDSAGPDIPGANDDGSGSATVIELARVLSKRKNESTLVFALFGGEEQGLRGSSYFVDHFHDLDKVDLMIQIDMANGSERLLPTIDVAAYSSPEWLVKASYEEFDKLGYTGLIYPTHFFTFSNALPGGGVGSDHQPFLEKNIPAIDFTSDPTDPIHTQQDTYENLEPSGLKRSGDLVYKLVDRFDGGVPQEKTGRFYLLQAGRTPLFLPLSFLRAFIILSFLLSAVALWQLRRRRNLLVVSETSVTGERSDAVQAVVDDRKIPGLKLFLLMLIIQTCVWVSDYVVGFLKGVRYPWVAEPDGYFVLGFLGACIGIWISLQLARRLRLPFDPFRYYLRAVIILLALVGLLLLSSVKIALYPATALFFLAPAILVRQPYVKLFFWLLSPYFMYRLIFSESYELFARTVAVHSTAGFTASVVLQLLYVLFFSIWAFPFLLGFAAINRETKKDLLGLQHFRNRWGIVVVGGAFIVCAAVLATRPSYSGYWQPSISVDERLDGNTNSGTLALKSAEYMSGSHVHASDLDTIITGWTRNVELRQFQVSSQEWLTVDRSINVGAGSDSTIDILLKLNAKYRPYTLAITYSTSKQPSTGVSSPLAFTQTKKTLAFKWYSFPDTSLLIPVHFQVTGGDSITESIEAVFVQQFYPVQIERPKTNVVNRSTLLLTTKLQAK